MSQLLWFLIEKTPQKSLKLLITFIPYFVFISLITFYYINYIIFSLIRICLLTAKYAMQSIYNHIFTNSIEVKSFFNDLIMLK